MNCTPSARNSSRADSRCLVERANRSNLQTRSSSSFRFLASSMSRFSSGRGILCAGLAVIYIFSHLNRASGRVVRPQVTQLHVAVLIFGADTGIDSDSGFNNGLHFEWILPLHLLPAQPGLRLQMEGKSCEGCWTERTEHLRLRTMMRYVLERESRIGDQLLQFLSSYHKEEMSLSDLCREFGVSRPTGYRWINRYKEVGPEGLLDLSRKPAWLLSRNLGSDGERNPGVAYSGISAFKGAKGGGSGYVTAST
jgi:transposase-like protein